MATSPKQRPSGARSVPHVGKTPEERRAYVEQVVKGQGLSSTVPAHQEAISSGTDSPSRDAGVFLDEAPSSARARRRRKSEPGFFAKHWVGVLTTVGIAAVLAAAGWMFVTNREVGEIHQGQTDLRDRMSRLEKRVDDQTSKQDSIISAFQEKLSELRVLFSASRRDDKPRER